MAKYVIGNIPCLFTVVVYLIEYAEPDAFFCFTNLMAEIRDNFIKTLDDSACGIGEYCVCYSIRQSITQIYLLALPVR